jgi:hypothetical protein
MLGLTIKNRSGSDIDAMHLFKAESLRAKLHGIDGIGLGLTAFVFDGEWKPRVIRLTVILDHISNAVQLECARLQGQGTDNADIAATFRTRGMGTLVKHPALRSQSIFHPKALDMDERALARAKSKMLQRREREGFTLGVHGR